MRKSLFVVLSICFSLSLTTLAQNTTDVPVTSIIKDSVQDIPMQIRSDGGTYVTVKTKKGYLVKSVIQSIGDWELDTGLNVSNTDRKVYLDFSQPVPGTGPNGVPARPFDVAAVRPRLFCQVSTYSLSMFTIAPNTTVQGPMLIGFYDPATGDRYRINMTPDTRNINYYPETDYVDITCTGADANNRCNRWLITPNGLKGCVTTDCSRVKQNRVKLVKLVPYKGSYTPVDQGDYYMSFSIEVTNP